MSKQITLGLWRSPDRLGYHCPAIILLVVVVAVVAVVVVVVVVIAVVVVVVVVAVAVVVVVVVVVVLSRPRTGLFSQNTTETVSSHQKH